MRTPTEGDAQPKFVIVQRSNRRASARLCDRAETSRAGRFVWENDEPGTYHYKPRQTAKFHEEKVNKRKGDTGSILVLAC